MSGDFDRGDVARLVAALHDDATRFFSELDGGRALREDHWERPGGGGGVSRVLADGEVFEKCGVNRSVVEGVMPAQMAARLGAHASGDVELAFFVAGLSIVAHPRNPKVPTVHLNVRSFEVTRDDGTRVDAWLGGGTDLTPTYPHAEDAIHFHRTLKAIAERHHPSFYPRFKTWCDNYFVNLHRGEERRGVGGIFFDHLREGDSGLDRRQLFAFLADVGRPDRERADEPPAAGRLGVRPGLRARLLRGGAARDAGAAGLGECLFDGLRACEPSRPTTS